MYDPVKLASYIDKMEPRKDSQLLREFIISLPCELSNTQQQALVEELVATLFVSRGMLGMVFVHDEGRGNPHTHVMLTMRTLEDDGSFGTKCREWNKHANMQEWRTQWAAIINKHLELAGSEARIDHRSYQEQNNGMIPLACLSRAAYEMEKRGIRTPQGERNREIRALNQQHEKTHATLRQQLILQLEALQKAVVARVETARQQEIATPLEIHRQVAASVVAQTKQEAYRRAKRAFWKPSGWKIKAKQDWLSVRKLRAEKLAQEKQRQVVLAVAAQKKPAEAQKLAIAQLFTAWKSLVREEVKPQALVPPGPLQTLRTILGTCRDTLNHVQHRLVEAAKSQLEGLAKQLGDRKEAIFEQVTKLDIVHQQSPARLIQQKWALIKALQERVAATEAKIAHAHQIPESIAEIIRDLHPEKEEMTRQSAVLHTLEHVVEAQLQTFHHERIAREDERSHHYAESVRSIREKRMRYDERHQDKRMEKSSPENRIPEWQRELVEQSLQVEYEKVQPVYVNTLLFSQGHATRSPEHHTPHLRKNRHRRGKLPEELPLASSRELVFEAERESSRPTHTKPETRRTVRIAPEQESTSTHARTFRARGRERDRSP